MPSQRDAAAAAAAVRRGEERGVPGGEWSRGERVDECEGIWEVSLSLCLFLSLPQFLPHPLPLYSLIGFRTRSF